VKGLPPARARGEEEAAAEGAPHGCGVPTVVVVERRQPCGMGDGRWTADNRCAGRGGHRGQKLLFLE